MLEIDEELIEDDEKLESVFTELDQSLSEF